MTFNLTDPAPVPDEELDQMIWKLERDGMTPKMLSLMRELREVRRAKVEPVAYAVSNDAWNQGNHKQHINGKLCDLIFPGDTFHGKELKPGNYDHAFPLYSAPSSQGPLSAPDKWPEKLNWSHHDDMTQAEVMAWNNAIEACRAATLNHSGNSEQLEPVSNRDELPAKCWCQTCRPVTMNDMRFFVCPECGNKRCPRANDHRNACTGSNAPGQDGSAYPAVPKEVKGE